MPRLAALVTLAISAVLLVFAARLANSLVGTEDLANAKHLVQFDAVVVVGMAAAGCLLPSRWLPLALIPGALVLTATLVGAATVGRHADDILAALFILSASWQLGHWFTQRVTRAQLGEPFLTDMTIGGGLFGAVTLAFGRLGLIEWWTLGLVTAVVGGLGLAKLTRQAWATRTAFALTVVSSRITTVCVGICAFQLGLLVVWLSAPEIMYDALYSKTYLPELWADTGRIGPLTAHPHLNIMGLASVASTVGHVFAADDVGRWLQFFALPGLAAVLWRFAGPRSAVGPIVAVLICTSPQLSWQASTAYDDVLIGAAIAALAIAVFTSIGERVERPADWRIALVIGLLAGASIWLKLHTLVLAAVLVGGWIVAAGPASTIVPRLIGAGVGTLAFVAPPMVLRWIDTGNPLFPSYNNIFKSSYYLPVDERFDQPYWPTAQLSDVFKLPQQLLDAAPNLVGAGRGEYTVLVGAIGVALLIGWSRGRAMVVFWLALVAALAFWWINFRYARYLIPIGIVALLVILEATRRWSPGRIATPLAIGITAIAALSSFPMLLLQYWNIPNRTIPLGAAFGRWDREDYLRTVFPERNALLAYQRLAPAGARAFGLPHARVFLDGRDISPVWETQSRLALFGPVEGDVLSRLRRLGITWAVQTTTGPLQLWEQELIDRHGEIVFADRDYSVIHFVDEPQRPAVQPGCDPSLRGVPGCWAGLDRKPGVAAGEVATAAVPACPGQLVAMRVKIEGQGAPTNVVLDSDGDSRNIGFSSAVLPAGGTHWAYATVPPNATRVNVSITPGAGSVVSAADFAGTGACPTQSGPRAAKAPR